MRGAPAALATVLVLSGLRTVGAEPCPPRAALDGDKVAVERVAAELQRLGVTVTSADHADNGSCGVVRAQVAIESGGSIAVAVHGATRGSEGRVVSDAALAAAWIDSWTRSDIDNALWAAPPGPDPGTTTVVATPSGARALRAASAPGASPAAPGASPATPGASRASGELLPPGDVPPSTAVTRTSRWDRVAIAVSYEQTASDDDASWRGATGSVCVMVGGFCVGGRVRAAFDPERLYNSTAVARSDLSALATASRPLAIGRMTIAPELGLGLGRLATRRVESACKPVMPMNCDPMDPMCVPEMGNCDPTDPGTTTAPKFYVGDNFSAATYAPRIALALRVAVPLFEHVWLDGLAGYTFAPFSHTPAFATSGDPNAGPNTPDDPTALPGEPSSGYVLGVGIRVGAK